MSRDSSSSADTASKVTEHAWFRLYLQSYEHFWFAGKRVTMTTPDRLVTFDNNILIDLRKGNEPVATYVRQLLDFNSEGKITVATTISTMLEKQRAGEEMSIQEYIAWLQKIGFASEHIFIGSRTVAFNVQGMITWDIDRELALNQCIHYAMVPNIPFHWREYLDQQCTKKGIVGTRREGLIELDNKMHLPYIPYSPQAPRQRPTPALDTLDQDEIEILSDLYLDLHDRWGNAKNDTLGLYNHLTNAVHTTYPDQSIFITSDKRHFLNKIGSILRCGFRGEILPPADAVAFIKKVAV